MKKRIILLCALGIILTNLQFVLNSEKVYYTALFSINESLANAENSSVIGLHKLQNILCPDGLSSRDGCVYTGKKYDNCNLNEVTECVELEEDDTDEEDYGMCDDGLTPHTWSVNVNDAGYIYCISCGAEKN